MDTLLELESLQQKSTLSFAQAFSLCMFITATTFLGIVHGKHSEKTVQHLEIPVIHNAVRTGRRMEE